LRGSENNDPFRLENGRVVTETNHAGGILGGITTGMPILFRAAFKPTPSIAKTQRTVDLVNMEETTIAVGGRHDPCIVPRAVPCVEAAAALAVYDAWLGRKKEL
ncbi:MAG: chorismate synthase, partial [Oscillospiraceae bacterium]|nr:chorismate synthase [Oscillospiraceae bacterium]